MKICIVSSDKRYIKVNELLLQRGYDSFICSYDTVRDCDCILLSVRNELSDEQLSKLFKEVSKETLVLCGNGERIGSFFDGRIIDYGKDEGFVWKNARLTAEAALPWLYDVTSESVENKKVFVVGYGRIGRELSKILKSLGAKVCSYARRTEIKEQMMREGVSFANLESVCDYDIVINTVPANIFTCEVIDKIPKSTLLVELASFPYGFENMSRVHIASALPGKYLPTSASLVVFDTICKILSANRTEEL